MDCAAGLPACLAVECVGADTVCEVKQGLTYQIANPSHTFNVSGTYFSKVASRSGMVSGSGVGSLVMTGGRLWQTRSVWGREWIGEWGRKWLRGDDVTSGVCVSRICGAEGTSRWTRAQRR